MGMEYLSSNMTAGELTPELRARTDIERYQNGVANATNMIILPHGGLRRRQGLSKIEDSEVTTSARMLPFVFNANQTYLIVLKPLSIDIFRDGILVSTEVSLYTEEQLYEVDAIQSADTMILAHELHPPKKLQRQGSDTTWDFSDITFLNQPAEWGETNGYPRTCTFFGGRLWLAATTLQPTNVWGSKVNGFFDFDLGAGEADFGIADILDSDQYDAILNIFAARTLQIFTTGGEYYNSAGQAITPENSGWQRQTAYGTTKIRPVLIDGATIFVDSSGRTIRQYLYDYNEDGYVSINASLLSSHLITEVVAMDAIKGTRYDVGDYVYVVNGDGTVAVLNTMRKEEISGWTHWETDGNFKDVCVLNKDVYFLVERKGVNFIEKLTENTYTDHNVVLEGTEPETFEVVHLGDEVTFSGDDVIYTDTSTGTLATALQTDFESVFMTEEFKVVADFSIMDDQLPTGVANDNVITVDRGAYRIEAGINYLTNVTTLPISTESKAGSTYHRRKRVVKVDINVIDSLGVYARDRFTGDRKFTVVLDQAPEPFTGFKEMYLLGYSRETTIEVSQKEPLPFLLRALGYEIVY